MTNIEIILFILQGIMTFMLIYVNIRVGSIEKLLNTHLKYIDKEFNDIKNRLNKMEEKS